MVRRYAPVPSLMMPTRRMLTLAVSIITLINGAGGGSERTECFGLKTISNAKAVTTAAITVLIHHSQKSETTKGACELGLVGVGKVNCDRQLGQATEAPTLERAASNCCLHFGQATAYFIPPILTALKAKINCGGLANDA